LSTCCIAAWTSPPAIIGHIAVNGFRGDAPDAPLWLALAAAVVAIVASIIALSGYRLSSNERPAIVMSLVLGIICTLALLFMPRLN
jgi:uncharacterized membrane protein (DUF441 family)